MTSIYEKIDRNNMYPFRDINRVREVHAQIEKLVERERPDPEEFRGILSDSEIDEDLKKVQELEVRWSQSNDQETNEIKMKSDIAEYMIYKNLGGWMNQSAVPLMTAKPDDYLRGVDLIIESENGEKENGKDIEHLGIGIDVALASERGFSASVEKKTKKVRQILKSGKMTEAKYVSGGSYEGKIENLPYTILSIGPSHVEQLFSNVLRKDQSEKEKNHILKYIVAYQIVLQLGTYYDVANKTGKKAMAYEIGMANNMAMDIFGHSINELQMNPEIWEKVAHDQGTKEIADFCDALQKELTN